MDGGIADNIGLRAVLHALSSTDGEFSVLRLMNRKKVKRVAVIAVNARTRKPTEEVNHPGPSAAEVKHPCECN